MLTPFVRRVHPSMLPRERRARARSVKREFTRSRASSNGSHQLIVRLIEEPQRVGREFGVPGKPSDLRSVQASVFGEHARGQNSCRQPGRPLRGDRPDTRTQRRSRDRSERRTCNSSISSDSARPRRISATLGPGTSVLAALRRSRRRLCRSASLHASEQYRRRDSRTQPARAHVCGASSDAALTRSHQNAERRASKRASGDLSPTLTRARARLRLSSSSRMG